MKILWRESKVAELRALISRQLTYIELLEINMEAMKDELAELRPFRGAAAQRKLYAISKAAEE
jgi:hypothetical protein